MMVAQRSEAEALDEKITIQLAKVRFDLEGVTE